MHEVLADTPYFRVREIFLLALEEPSEEGRAALIARETRGDAALCEAVESLLAHHKADDFLETPAADLHEGGRLGAARASSFLVAEARTGEFIGRYKLLEKIGEGGCGAVYQAEQFEPVRRRVALKIIKLGMDTRSVVARFEAERQALALMDHPGIARVFDGGASLHGRPYFVMELVRGVRITEYCEANKLALRDRIALFVSLCHAIQHAHQKGVIHRDIKPSNVLVTMNEGKPAPKVIDFGIAKAIEEPLTEKTLFTNFQAFIGTPAYTSPEQAQMAGADVDTRSDIYSLGVLLYEVLTGVTPFDPKELTRSGIDEMRRMIAEVDPPLPSTRLQPRGTAASHQKAGRGAGLDRDLDCIVMKCLEKDRSQRYATAQDLANDLERYLKDEPILARPPSASYRLRKAFRRNRAVFAAGMAAVLALIAGAGLSLWQAYRATQAEHRESLLRQNAEHERERAVLNRRKAEANEYIADINLAHQSIAAGNIARAIHLLGKHRSAASRDDRRGFEWRYLWQLAQGDTNLFFAQESSSVFSLAAIEPGRALAVGMRERINIYDLDTGRPLKSINAGAVSLAHSPAGFLAAAAPNAVRVWRSYDGPELWSDREYSGPVSFAPNGTNLVAARRGGLRLLDAASGQALRDFADALPPFAFSPDGRTLVANSREGLAIWETEGESRRLTLSGSAGMLDMRWTRERPIVQFAPSGAAVVAARNSARESSAFALEVWDSGTGNHLFTLPGLREAPEHIGAVSGLSFSPDGSLLASTSWDHSLRLWDLEQRRCVKAMHGNLAEVWALAFAPGGRQVITGAKDGAVLIWPVERAEQESTIPGRWAPLGFSRDGRLLGALKDDETIALLNPRTRRVESEVRLPLRRPRFAFPFPMAISPDLGTFLEMTGSGIIRAWNLQTQEHTEWRSARRLISLGFSPDGAAVLAGNREGSIAVFDMHGGGRELARIEGERAFFSDDGTTLVTIVRNGFDVLDWPSRERRGSFDVDPPPRHRAALSPDGRILASSSDPLDVENAIRLWDTRSGSLLGICSGHTQGVGSLAFSPDGRTLASTSSDSTLRLWNVETQQQLLEISQIGSPFHEMLFAPDGTSLVVRTTGGALRIFEAPAAN